MPRSPAGEIYAGLRGTTHTERFHVSCPCGLIFVADLVRGVNATRDLDVAARARAGSLHGVVCSACGAESRVEMPFVYHDEARRLLVLVLPAPQRHRELEERAALLLAMAEEKGALVPPYARDFVVVWGPQGLGLLLETRSAPPSEGESLLRPEAAAVASAPPPAAPLAATPLAATPLAAAPLAAASLVAAPEDRTGPFQPLEPDELDFPAAAPRAESHLLDDVALEHWIVSGSPTLHRVEQGRVRLCAALAVSRLEPFLEAELAWRIQLHRTPQYPLILLSVVPVGSPDAESLTFQLDPARVEDRSVLGALGLSFQLVLDLYDPDHLPVVHRAIEAPLAENVRYIVSAAEESLSTIPAPERSFQAALEVWRQPGFDRWGRRDPELQEDSFALLPAARATRLALGVVSYWNEPDHEDYLILVRSFPLAWWQKIRSRVVKRAVELGLALSPAMAQVALGEGLARSRKELVFRLAHAFAEVAGLPASDLDEDSLLENWRLLVAECEALGMALPGKAGDLAAAAVGALPKGGVVAGEIRAPGGPPRRDMSKLAAGELRTLLEDKDLRRDASIELCRRSEASAVGPVFGALRRMTRGEAVRVIPALVGFGDRAVPHLIEGLRSRKAFVRQGCALALGVLKSDDGIEALCDLLVSEPTDMWREVARAIGEMGAGAIMSLAARMKDAERAVAAEPPREGTVAGRDRIAWALAHVAARGGRPQVETLVDSQDPAVAAAAQRAVDLVGTARDNDAEVRGTGTPRDQTVNRAFSRRFFEALAGRIPRSLAKAETEGFGGDELGLDDIEILVEPDEEPLDDDDLLPG